MGGDSLLLCHHAGCSNAVSTSCPVQFCCTRAFGATCTGPRLVRVASVTCVVATPFSPDLVPWFLHRALHQLPMHASLKASTSVFLAKLFLSSEPFLRCRLLCGAFHPQCSLVEDTSRVQHIPVHSPLREPAMSVPFAPNGVGAVRADP